MAMIQCEECGQWISDRAYSCPHCGCPMYEDDYYDEGYENESGRIQARRDALSETQERNARIMKRWRKDYIAISVVMLYVMYIIGLDLSKHHVWVGIVGLLICYLITLIMSGLSFWKLLILHMLAPKLFGYEVITLCSCIGYTIGFVKGLYL